MLPQQTTKCLVLHLTNVHNITPLCCYSYADGGSGAGNLRYNIAFRFGISAKRFTLALAYQHAKLERANLPLASSLTA